MGNINLIHYSVEFGNRHLHLVKLYIIIIHHHGHEVRNVVKVGVQSA